MKLGRNDSLVLHQNAAVSISISGGGVGHRRGDWRRRLLAAGGTEGPPGRRSGGGEESAVRESADAAESEGRGGEAAAEEGGEPEGGGERHWESRRWFRGSCYGLKKAHRKKSLSVLCLRVMKILFIPIFY